MVEAGKIYVGVVKDNNDPKRLGRVRVSVLDVFDNLETEDIPWASPWKDHNGNSINIPDIGKVVSVMFDNGNIYMPEYMYAQHHNVNLSSKLREVDSSDYTSFKSVLFDHKTQIYSNDSEGLKMDYNMSNINISKTGNISLNLRDNKSFLFLGSPDADQPAILGDTWMNWFDKLINTLLGESFLGNLSAPVLPTPGMINVLLEYQALREEFLSKHVWIADNMLVKPQERSADPQIGDSWKSTIMENKPIVDTNYTKPELEERADYKPSNPSSTNNGESPNEWKNQMFEPADAPVPVGSEFSAYKSGEIPIDKMIISKYMGKFLTGDSRYLIPAAAKSLDQLLDAYNSSSFKGKQAVSITDGYRTQKNQDYLYNVSPKAPLAARIVGAHGRGTAVDLWWGVRTKPMATQRNPVGWEHPVYRWFYNNAYKFGWINPSWANDHAGSQDEWWHWEYHGPNVKQPVLSPKFSGEFDFNTGPEVIKRNGGTFKI